jgi:hypothetical protein
MIDPAETAKPTTFEVAAWKKARMDLALCVVSPRRSNRRTLIPKGKSQRMETSSSPVEESMANNHASKQLQQMLKPICVLAPTISR